MRVIEKLRVSVIILIITRSLEENYHIDSSGLLHTLVLDIGYIRSNVTIYARKVEDG